MVKRTEDNQLTKETEMTDLMPEGMSNRQIANKLVGSPRTVNGHMERILT